MVAASFSSEIEELLDLVIGRHLLLILEVSGQDHGDRPGIAFIREESGGAHEQPADPFLHERKGVGLGLCRHVALGEVDEHLHEDIVFREFRPIEPTDKRLRFGRDGE